MIELAGLSEAQKRAYIIADNKLALNAGWDAELLALEFGRSEGLGFDLALTGFARPNWLRCCRSAAGLTDPRRSRPSRRAGQPPGDLWLLGSHRLLCGDSTVAADVARVLEREAASDGHRSALWRELRSGLAEPARAERQRRRRAASQRRSRGLARRLGAVPRRRRLCLARGAVSRQHGSGILVASGFELRSQIIWAKDRFALFRGDYHWQHEPCQPAGTRI